MTHEYTLLLGGQVLGAPNHPRASAIAWAEGTVIAIGSDEEVRGISRGDSAMVDLRGATVIPLGTGIGAAWPADAELEIGAPADLAILARDPRSRRARGERPAKVPLEASALIRRGHVVSGSLPGIRAHDDSAGPGGGKVVSS